MSKRSKRIQVTVPPELIELAKILKLPPERILEQFVRDLLRLPGSSGSDERKKAGEYFLRTNLVGFAHQNAISDFIAVSREEYLCQVCQKWVRYSALRLIREPKPHFVCWSHPPGSTPKDEVRS